MSELVRVAFAVSAHPDDIEFNMAGTLLLLQRAGCEIHYMTLGSGSCGSVELDRDAIVEVRCKEARAAAAFAGAIFHESLVDDLDIFYELRTLRRLASVMREVAPDIVLTHPPDDYMEDHTNTCRLALTAAFATKMPNFRVEPPRAPVQQDITVYHAQPHMNRDPFGRLVEPQLFVDIGEVLEDKRAMLSHHQSQKRWLDVSQGMDSYLQAMVDSAAGVGKMSGKYAHAEGWRRHYHAGFSSQEMDPLRDALQGRVLLRNAGT
ncbi:MAG TPA: PIG-L family deacetylase [Polyangiaceae bacterium]|jgi:LmbE family N-acetylglucosaminyl deacetylase